MELFERAWAIGEQAFEDEFGPIERPVYEAGQQLWPRLESHARQTLGDGAAGQRLLMKACALVTRKYRENPAAIQNLPAYLHRTWQRLVLAELEKLNGHRRLAAQLVAEETAAQTWRQTSAELDRRILLQQIIGQMDDWTRRVFEYLTLGFTYDEIAAQMGGNGHALRMRFDRQIKQLTKRLNPLPTTDASQFKN